MANAQEAKADDPGIVRFREERDQMTNLGKLIGIIEDPEMKHSARVTQFVARSRDKIVKAYEEGRPFIANNYCTAPELGEAMDLPWFMLFDAPFTLMGRLSLPEVIDESVAMGLGTDLCTAIRTNIYYIEKNLVPVPTAAVGFVFPCDGMPMLHQVMGHSSSCWKDVPLICPDPAPYFHDGSVRSIDYFANELRKTAAFLEEHTGQKLDLDKLKAVITESNKHYELWQEYNDLRRAVPAPHGHAMGGQTCYSLAQIFAVGDPDATVWFEDLVELAETRVAQKRGIIEGKEEIRLFWFDLNPTTFADQFMPWLEEEFGAVVVMDMLGNHDYTTIDTSSEDEIWRGLAKRGLFDTPMVRQAIGTADGFVNDLVRIVEDYKIDVVIWPGHMGHKEMLGTYGIMREACRELGVHFLDIRMDIWDHRYTPIDQIKDKFARFFSAAGYV
jgi:benzoyl-CoA reductase/2-hydroxyglutaryl-CoA dehydratase subunit BcrC/BadD/HgdB